MSDEEFDALVEHSLGYNEPGVAALGP